MIGASKPYLLLSLKSSMIISSFLMSLTESAKHGFTVELIHRDCPKSPFHNNPTSLSPFQLVNNALHRSFNRVNHFFPKAEADLFYDPESDVFFRDGEFLMEYYLGTPLVHTYGILDTGSNLIWTQCEPCDPCFDQTPSKFLPENSSTYVSPFCDYPQCQYARASVNQIFCGDSSLCLYVKKYGNGFISKGNIAYDTLTLTSTSDGKVAFPKTLFGCARDNGGARVSWQTSGVVGLGRGPLSLISQRGSSVKGKFSYCLIDPFFSDVTSKLSFGQNAVVSGPGTLSTPLVPTASSSLRYITIEGISVGDTRLDFMAGNDSTSDIKGGQYVHRFWRNIYCIAGGVLLQI